MDFSGGPTSTREQRLARLLKSWMDAGAEAQGPLKVLLYNDSRRTGALEAIRGLDALREETVAILLELRYEHQDDGDVV